MVEGPTRIQWRQTVTPAGPKRRWVILGAAFVCLVVTLGARPRDWTRLDAIRAEIADRGLDAEQVIKPILIDDAMRAFAHEAVANAGGQARQRLEALVRHLSDQEALGLTYAWGYTGTNREVFETGEANCLAFTNLYIGMARAVGLRVDYLLVRGDATFRKEDDLVIVSDHVAVGFGHGPGRLIVDLAQEPEQDIRNLEVISDLTALALFYTNRGAEALRNDTIGDAIEHLRIAVALDPEFPASWVNYGVALRRKGDFQGAEDAYRRALEIDPRARSALVNLASLLRLASRKAEAEALELVLARKPGRNPYTYLALGDISLVNGRVPEAIRLYRRALRLDRSEAESWAALGQASLAAGDTGAARKFLKKAKRRDPEHPRSAALATALGDG